MRSSRFSVLVATFALAPLMQGLWSPRGTCLLVAGFDPQRFRAR